MYFPGALSIPIFWRKLAFNSKDSLSFLIARNVPWTEILPLASKDLSILGGISIFRSITRLSEADLTPKNRKIKDSLYRAEDLKLNRKVKTAPPGEWLHKHILVLPLSVCPAAALCVLKGPHNLSRPQCSIWGSQFLTGFSQIELIKYYLEAECFFWIKVLSRTHEWTVAGVLCESGSLERATPPHEKVTGWLQRTCLCYKNDFKSMLWILLFFLTTSSLPVSSKLLFNVHPNWFFTPQNKSFIRCQTSSMTCQTHCLDTLKVSRSIMKNRKIEQAIAKNSQDTGLAFNIDQVKDLLLSS